jgi:threonine dehydrogenase-like Zn-dependent dehydrogenase
MRALAFDGQVARVVDRAAPEPRAGFAVVAVHLAGICRTDLELVKGYMGFRGVLGHEFVGEVLDGPDAWRGARVVGEINFGCGQCAACARGMKRHCPTRQVLGILDADGAFAEAVAIPVENLHRVPASVADEEAVFAEPLAAAFEILEQVEIAAGGSVVVLGDGKLGLLVAQVLAGAGARVLAVGKHDDKLELLRRRGIATARLDQWNRAKADVVVEASGTAAGFALAIAATRPRGTLVLKSTVAEGADLNLAPLVIDEITVVGSRCGPFAPALAALVGGGVDVRSLIAAELPLARGVEALELAAQPGVAKVLLRP